jgi:glycosyltransferase EpsF
MTSHQPRRVLHVFGAMNRGGAETLVMNVYRHMDRDRIQFDFAVHSQETCDYDDEIEQLGGRIYRLKPPHSGTLWEHLQGFRNVLRTQGTFAAVHSHVHFFSGALLGLAYREGILIRVAHSHTTQDGQGNSLPRRWYRAALGHAIGRLSTHRLGCSAIACDALFGAGSVNAGTASILPNGIDATCFTGPDRRAELRAALGLSASSTVIGHVGRFEPMKNHGLLLQVFERFLQVEPSAHLLLVGEGPLRTDMEDQVREKKLSSSVTFLGLRNDVPELLKAMDLFLFPSEYEGLGLAVIEAQAAGVPVVCSDRIPAEADLGLGGIRRVPLDASADTWMQAMHIHRLTPVKPWRERCEMIRQRQYDILQTTERLRGIYSGSTG